MGETISPREEKATRMVIQDGGKISVLTFNPVKKMSAANSIKEGESPQPWGPQLSSFISRLPFELQREIYKHALIAENHLYVVPLDTWETNPYLPQEDSEFASQHLSQVLNFLIYSSLAPNASHAHSFFLCHNTFLIVRNI